MVMSRKARLTVYRDRLEAVSSCPSVIFNNFEPSDSDFDFIKRAEQGEVAPTEEISARLFDIYKDEKEPNDALLYFLRMGLELKSPLCAILLIECIDRYNTHFYCLADALSIVADTDRAKDSGDLIERVTLKGIIASLSPECDFKALKEQLEEMNTKDKACLWLYLEAKSLEYRGEYDKENTRALLDEFGIGKLADLPTFGGIGERRAPQDSDQDDFNAIKRLFFAFDMYEWSDFWLRVAYEYASLRLDGDITPFADYMLLSISRRPWYSNKELHELAIKKYIYEHGLGYTGDELEQLERRCRFNGLSVSEENDEIIKEAVYTKVTLDENRVCALGYDAEIQHERNRYTLTMTLSNHKKRASRHQWEGVIAIRTDDDTPPEIMPVPIVERRAEISRNGITFEKEKKASQLLSRGEIKVGDKVSPLELDLIIDISYVSLTKCTHCALKVERFKRQGEYLVMQTDISIYDTAMQK